MALAAPARLSAGPSLCTRGRRAPAVRRIGPVTVCCELNNRGLDDTPVPSSSKPSPLGGDVTPLRPIQHFLHGRKSPFNPQAASGDGSGAGGNGHGGSGDHGGHGDGSSDGQGRRDDDQEKILNLKEVEELCEAAKVELPKDMLETAAKCGLRASVLHAYLAMQGSFFAGMLMRSVPFIRDRMLADPKFLFKVGAEIAIDAGCCTVAEVRKRGDHFWSEFELYLSDVVVGLVLDMVLVTLMAPCAVLGGVPAAAASQSALSRFLSTVPSAFFEANVPGIKSYGVAQRFACLAVKFCEYSLAGMACGLVGQALANSLMTLKRKWSGSKDDDVPVPPLIKTALVWGLFMGVSSNLRYQTVFGIERLVDSTIGKRVPAIAYASTVGVRFMNNVIGGENFIDLARWAGVQ